MPTEQKLSPSGLSEDDLRAIASSDMPDEELEALGALDEIKALRGESDEDETGDEPAATPSNDEGAAGLTSGQAEEVEEPAPERDPKGKFRKASDRIRELNDARKAAETKARELEERLAALEQAKAEPEAQPEPQVDPLDEIKAAKRALGQQYDEGEITFAQYQDQAEALDERKLQIALQRTQVDPREMARAAVVEEQIDELKGAHAAWFDALPEHERIDAINRGKTQAFQAGARGAEHSLLVVQHAIDTAIRLGLAPAGVASPLSSQPPVRATRQPKVTDQKLAMARTHPPDLHAAPAPKKADALTVEEAARLSPREFDRLPEHVKKALYAEAGIT